MWEKILKFKIRSFGDARRAGKEYALEDYYESMLLSEEEYQKLSNKEKGNLHQKLYVMLEKYGKDSWAEQRRQFHSRMFSKARYEKETTMLPSEDGSWRRTLPTKTEQEQRMERRKTRSQMIIDYFTMWRNMYNRLPTLTEITNSEGRPLTVDEKRTFNEEYTRRTQE